MNIKGITLIIVSLLFSGCISTQPHSKQVEPTKVSKISDEEPKNIFQLSPDLNDFSIERIYNSSEAYAEIAGNCSQEQLLYRFLAVTQSMRSFYIKFNHGKGPFNYERFNDQIRLLEGAKKDMSAQCLAKFVKARPDAYDFWVRLGIVD